MLPLIHIHGSHMFYFMAILKNNDVYWERSKACPGGRRVQYGSSSFKFLKKFLHSIRFLMYFCVESEDAEIKSFRVIKSKQLRQG